MEDEVFNAKVTGFWGAIASLFGAIYSYFKYKATRQRTREAEINLQLKLEGKIMSELHGLKETKEVLEASKAVSLFIIKKVKDGVQLQDGVDLVSALLLDAEFRKKIEEAVAGIQSVPAELGDLNANEIAELIMFGAASIPEYVEALKK